MEQNDNFEDEMQKYSIYFQNTPSCEQVLFLYRNAINDYIHKKALDHLRDTKGNN